MKNEVWKPIKRYDGKYDISNFGRVRSFKTRNRKPKILKQYKEANGYMRLGVSHNAKRDHISVHREVGIYFIPNPDNKPNINHKDGNRENNHYSNIEWCTQSENIQHAYDTGLRPFDKKGEAHHNSKLTEKDVLSIKKDLKEGIKSQSDIAKDYPVDASVISNINTGKLWSHIKLKE